MDTVLDPFTLLQDLAEKSAPGANEQAASLVANAQLSAVAFRLLGENLVVPMDEVAEMLECPDSTRIPGVKSWVRGVANVRGRLLPLIDLAVYFEGQMDNKRQQQRVLVSDTGDIYYGVIVSEVLGMLHIPASTKKSSSVNPAIHELLRPYISGCYTIDEKQWPVFSLQRLSRAQKFLQAAV